MRLEDGLKNLINMALHTIPNKVYLGFNRRHREPLQPVTVSRIRIAERLLDCPGDV